MSEQKMGADIAADPRSPDFDPLAPFYRNRAFWFRRHARSMPRGALDFAFSVSLPGLYVSLSGPPPAPSQPARPALTLRLERHVGHRLDPRPVQTALAHRLHVPLGSVPRQIINAVSLRHRHNYLT